MRILFDQGVPAPLRDSLPNHTVATAYELAWSTLENGVLLAEAEKAGFDLFITTDQNLRYQQNLSGRTISILVLPTTRWSVIKQHGSEIATAVDSTRPGQFLELSW